MRVSLEQWRVLVAVVDAGSHAAAASALHKTQSSVSYAIARIEQLLDVEIFVREGRRAVLTDAGAALCRRARLLLEEAARIEDSAAVLAAGYESELQVAADIVFPVGALFAACAAMAERCPQTRVQIHETVLGGTDEALIDGLADIALTPHVPQGFLGEPLCTLRFIAVAAPGHPLFEAGRPLRAADLQRHRHLVIRDTGLRLRRDAGWLAAEQRWTVSQLSSSIAAIEAGHGYAWLPEPQIADRLRDGRLRPLPLHSGGERRLQVYLVLGDPDGAGPACRELAAQLRDRSAALCAGARSC